jgi:hypothetical protein
MSGSAELLWARAAAAVGERVGEEDSAGRGMGAESLDPLYFLDEHSESG